MILDSPLWHFTNNFKRFLNTFISDLRVFFYFRFAGISIESKDVERVFSCNGHWPLTNQCQTRNLDKNGFPMIDLFEWSDSGS